MSPKQMEEAKRNRHYDPVLRWKHLQEAIAWAEANLPLSMRRSTPVAAKKREAKLLEHFERSPRK